MARWGRREKINYSKTGHKQSRFGVKYRTFRFPVKIITRFISDLKETDV